MRDDGVGALSASGISLARYAMLKRSRSSDRNHHERR